MCWHKWSKWEEHLPQTGSLKKTHLKDGGSMTGQQYGQKRTCKKCDYTEYKIQIVWNGID